MKNNYKPSLFSSIRKTILIILLSFSYCFQIDAQLIPCNAHFIHQQPSASNGIYFSGSINPTGAVYTWNFGDGSSGTGINTITESSCTC